MILRRLGCLFLIAATAALLCRAAGAAEEFVVTGTVTRSFTGGAVRSGKVELRWPGHEDEYAPVVADLADDGAYSLRFTPEQFGGALSELAVGVVAKGFAPKDRRLFPDGTDPQTPVKADFELAASTLDGLLDTFSCCLLNWGVLTVMVPAFFLGAAIKVFVPSHQFLRYLGPTAPRPTAYGAAVGSGMVLSLCSCNVVPLFISIWRSGAGIGPAFAFLYAGPAINVLSLAFTWKLIGTGMSIWRLVAVAVMSIALGLAMEWLFRSSEAKRRARTHETIATSPRRGPAVTMVVLLAGLLVTGTLEIGWKLQAGIMVALAVALVAVAVFWLERDFCIAWLRETGGLLLRTAPILVPAVIVIGLMAQAAPLQSLDWLISSNSVATNLAAAAAGALMYFPILTEVAFVKTALKVIGIGTGPAMAILLTAPGLSLPGMIIVGREIRLKRLLCYVILLVIFATIAGMFFGSTWGSYLCTCEYK